MVHILIHGLATFAQVEVILIMLLIIPVVKQVTPLVLVQPTAKLILLLQFRMK
jgi:hypothetical protein